MKTGKRFSLGDLRPHSTHSRVTKEECGYTSVPFRLGPNGGVIRLDGVNALRGPKLSIGRTIWEGTLASNFYARCL